MPKRVRALDFGVSHLLCTYLVGYYGRNSDLLFLAQKNKYLVPYLGVPYHKDPTIQGTIIRVL